MIAKFATILWLVGMAHAGYIHDGGLGYDGYSGYVAPVYTTPVLTKAVIPAVSYAPAVSTVSRYQVHSTPVVKTYAPVAYAAAAPIAVSYGGHGYGGYGYGGHGYGGYGYGDHGYGSKHLW